MSETEPVLGTDTSIPNQVLTAQVIGARAIGEIIHALVEYHADCLLEGSLTLSQVVRYSFHPSERGET